MKKRNKLSNITEIRRSLYSYYISAAFAGIAAVMTGVLTLFVYPIPSIGIPICLLSVLVWIICCSQVYATRLKKISDTLAKGISTEELATPTKLKARTWLLVAVGIICFMAAGNFAFPLWLRSIFLAVIIVICLCLALWHSSAYKTLYFILTKKEE